MPKRSRAVSESSENPATPTHKGRQNLQHFPTPTKAKIQGAIEYLEKRKIPHLKADVFEVFRVKKGKDGDF
jgi:hypothetical protein